MRCDGQCNFNFNVMRNQLVEVVWLTNPALTTHFENKNSFSGRVVLFNLHLPEFEPKSLIGPDAVTESRIDHVLDMRRMVFLDLLEGVAGSKLPRAMLQLDGKMHWRLRGTLL